MKHTFLTLSMLCITIHIVWGQQSRQSLVSIESRVGYSTNTYLNPFYSEWDTSVEGGYGVISLLGQRHWYRNGNSIEATGGLIVEPFFSSHNSWKGGLGVLRYQRRLSGQFSSGVEVGGSYFTSSFERAMMWAQPSLTWFPSPFTALRVKAGSNLRSYRNISDSLNTDAVQRVDTYALEFELWPDFQWHLKTGLYGQLKDLPSVQKGFTSTFSIGYLFRRGAQIKLHGRLEQYQQSVVTTSNGPQGGGFPPIGIPSGSTQTEIETDRIIRLGLSGDYPLNEKWSLFARIERLGFYSTKSDDFFSDMQVSGGVRFSFEPRFGQDKHSIVPEWNKSEGKQTLRIHYKGEGRLYLTGDFNDWERPGVPLVRQSEDMYIVRLSLDPGAYEYRILRLNGTSEEWVEVSDDSYTVSDGFGGKNILLLLE